jgi:hypothetical protein
LRIVILIIVTQFAARWFSRIVVLMKVRVKHVLLSSVLSVLSVHTTTLSYAQSAGTPGVSSSEETPWGKGVSEDNKIKARALLAEGNAEFVADRHLQALKKYEEALSYWMHPAIAFNAVRALVRLERPVEAAETLKTALQYGAAPMSPELYAEAMNYQTLLRGMVANVDVKCEQPASLSLSGKLVTCPGSKSFQVVPGKHVLAASHPGYIAVNRPEVLLAGDNPPIILKMITVQAATITKTKWATWKPWAVVGGGAALVGIGVGLELNARSIRDEYRAAVQLECNMISCKDGTDRFLSEPEKNLDSSWRFRHVSAISVLAAGGVVLATGAALLVMNRPYTVVREQRESGTVSNLRLGIDPVNRGIVASGSF